MRDSSVTIHLVGETIDAKRAHQRAQAGELVQLVRGVYVADNVDADAAILGHAIRIAHYLYPAAYLSSPSASCWRSRERPRRRSTKLRSIF